MLLFALVVIFAPISQMLCVLIVIEVILSNPFDRCVVYYFFSLSNLTQNIWRCPLWANLLLVTSLLWTNEAFRVLGSWEKNCWIYKMNWMLFEVEIVCKLTYFLGCCCCFHLKCPLSHWLTITLFAWNDNNLIHMSCVVEKWSVIICWYLKAFVTTLYPPFRPHHIVTLSKRFLVSKNITF